MLSAPWTIALAASAALALPLQKGGSKDRKGGKEKPGTAAAAVPSLDPWLGKLEDARARAKARNVPILVHIVLEGEEANDAYRDKVLTDADLLRRSAGALVIVANNGTHARQRVEQVVAGEQVSREVCAAFPAFESCAQHQATWQDLYVEFHEENGDLRCPQTIVLLPDGKVSGRINTSHAPDPAEISALVVEAQEKAGPGLTEDQLNAVVRGLEEGRRLTEGKLWVAAWRAWDGVLAITTKSPYADEARREQPKALVGMQAELDRISALLVPGTAAQGFGDLTKYAAELAGTPLEKEALARLKKAEADKAIKPEIAAWRLSLEADGLLREASQLTDAGETKKAERVVRRLLGKRYAGTPAQETARKLWPNVEGV